MTFTGRSDELSSYAAHLYKTAALGTPPQANAPEVFLELLDLLTLSNMIDLAVVDTVTDMTLEENKILDDGVVDHEHFITANSYPYESFLILKRNLTNITRTKELFLARIGAVVGFGFLVGRYAFDFYKRCIYTYIYVYIYIYTYISVNFSFFRITCRKCTFGLYE